MNGFGAPAQDGRITGLEAQAGGVDGHVGPRLVNDANHAQRHAHLADLNARGTKAHVADRTDRVRQAGYLTQAEHHAVDARRRQRQAFEHCRLQAIGAAGSQVPLVGSDQLGTGRVQRPGHGQQGTVLLRGTGPRDHPRSCTSGAAQAGHVVKNGLGHGLEGSWQRGKRLIIAAAPRD
jgi:hypothetical protein